ncbi:hypothetical protein DNTS_020291, partial [Danionella cerebrum]
MDEKAMDPSTGDNGMEILEASSGLEGAGESTGSRLDAHLQEASRLKSDGNVFYRQRNIRAAIGCYHRALLQLRCLDSEANAPMKVFGAPVLKLNPEQEELLWGMQIDCYNNLAACLLQKESVDHSRVLEYCQKVLQRKPADVKALYRAGVASLELGDNHAAQQYLLQASRGKPNGKNTNFLVLQFLILAV